MFAASREVMLDPARIRRMSEAIARRGPDGDGFYEVPGVSFAHRRLAIIDLSGGHQPMVSADQRHALVFNGEIYNYLELRARLIAEGANLRTNSDTEAILEGWRIWGERTLDLLRGMFAFALYDRDDDSLVLARDHFGIKPMFYTRLRDGTLAFASELSALWALGDQFDATLRTDAVIDFFTVGYVPDPKTVHRAAHKLPAAHWVRIRRGDREIAPRRFWAPEIPEPRVISVDDAIDGTLAVVEESVRAHLVADVPVSAFLSGGIDSGITTTLAAREVAGILAHTISFDDPRFDESELARLVARSSGVDHRVHRVDPPQPRDVVEILSAYHEPYADSSCIPTFALCRVAASESKVALSGDGGDEHFGGYRWYQSHMLRAKIARALPDFLVDALGMLGRAANNYRWPPALRPPGAGFLSSFDASLPASLVRAQSAMPYASLRNLLVGDFLRGLDGHDPYSQICDVSHKRFAGGRSADAFREAQNVDLHLYLPGDILTKVDRASMNCGLEVRVPFLDRKVFEWVASLPTETIFLNGKRKGLLVEAARRLLPATILTQPKRGFSVPLDAWFRGELMTILQGQLDEVTAELDGIVNRGFVNEIIARHRSGRIQAGTFLFALLAFSVFLANRRSVK